MTYRLSLFFYTQNQDERNENNVKSFYVWYEVTGAGAADGARVTIILKVAVRKINAHTSWNELPLVR